MQRARRIRRFRWLTQKGGQLYATLMGEPKPGTILLRDVRAASGSQVQLLGDAKPLTWSQRARGSGGATPGYIAREVRLRPADGTCIVNKFGPSSALRGVPLPIVMIGAGGICAMRICPHTARAVCG